MMSVVGRHQKPNGPIDPESLDVYRESLSGSVYGSRKELGEMLDFCAQHNILADIELISMQQVNEAFERVIDKKVRYRYVIDMASLQVNELVIQNNQKENYKKVASNLFYGKFDTIDQHFECWISSFDIIH